MADLDKFSRRLLNFTKITTEVLINVVFVILNKQFRLLGLEEMRFKNDHGRIMLLVGDAVEATVDERIAKIEAARSSLHEALSAVDELKERAEQNKSDLEYLTKQIERAEADKADLSGQLDALRKISAIDSQRVRTVLNLPTKVSIWTERVIAFGLGITASVVASFIYEYLKAK